MNIEVYSKVYETAHQQERQYVQKFIRNIKNGKVGVPLFLNLFAPKGFGKLAFLEQIRDEFKKILPTSLVRIGDFFDQGENEYFGLKHLLVHIIRELVECLPNHLVTFSSDYENWTNVEQLAELVNTVASIIYDYEKVMLLLIDDYDTMPNEYQRWFQNQVLSPISQMEKVAVLLTSETELRLTENFELRMRLESQKFSSIDVDTINLALPENESIAGYIYAVTGGMPKLVEELTQEFKRAGAKTSDDFIDQSRESYLAYLEKNLLVDLSADTREALLILSLFHRFDVNILKKVLPALDPESYLNYSTMDYLDLIDRLRPWVEWKREGGYALNKSIKLTLQSYVSTNQPDLYQNVSQVAESNLLSMAE